MQNAAYRVPRSTVATGVLLLLLCGSAPRAARADSADPSIECGLQGGTAMECDVGTPCVPNRCKTDADCGDSETCQQVHACLGSEMCDERGDASIETVEGECDDKGECGPTSTCHREKLCVRRKLEKDDDGCAVHAPGAAQGPGWVGLLGSVLAAFVLRGRHRRGVR